ncbi:nucleotide-diphospho-sugar transferase [Plectosphaerella cucumerina]|uniref:Nucleotide-diphospho-sugar transferase n=1 Tax=Plectosphaerella cucumerina TaxID=40658 RepID=A0A8K0XAD8_9PEZI|nr:nucleotide-diphospho-sugar transferase [Plectosphaerella cucumerina]
MLSRFLYHRLRLVAFVTLVATCLLLTASFGFYQPLAASPWYESINRKQKPGGVAATVEQAVTIPKKMWYKLGPKGLSELTRGLTDRCIEINPGYEVVFMTDSSAARWVENTFGKNHPELVKMFHGLRVPIFKADILRYLLLYTHGGVYNDLDVECKVPVDEWIPTEFQNKTALVVGWEFDVGWGDNILREFETWTIAAAPQSPHVWRVVEDTMAGFRKIMEENRVSVENVTLKMSGDVVDATGPRRFTRGVFSSLGERFNSTEKEVESLMEPRLLGDVLVLPGWSFAASSNRYGDRELPPPLVVHKYAGSWKNANGGESLWRRDADSK